ncbi:hypothetical protein CEXT_229561 [Caerostris extrusa]|uniref:Uncharacterized protein n=1 Tax=Caerostris extrusa TaxID=172846 RepID=A0AAV4MHF5_CAEEX|nr:hypothetical protein CEXT_229561 [Caerostris extrusa]
MNGAIPIIPIKGQPLHSSPHSHPLTSDDSEREEAIFNESCRTDHTNQGTDDPHPTPTPADDIPREEGGWLTVLGIILSAGRRRLVLRSLLQHRHVPHALPPHNCIFSFCLRLSLARPFARSLTPSSWTTPVASCAPHPFFLLVFTRHHTLFFSSIEKIFFVEPRIGGYRIKMDKNDMYIFKY